MFNKINYQKSFKKAFLTKSYIALWELQPVTYVTKIEYFLVKGGRVLVNKLVHFMTTNDLIKKRIIQVSRVGLVKFKNTLFSFITETFELVYLKRFWNLWSHLDLLFFFPFEKPITFIRHVNDALLEWLKSLEQTYKPHLLF